MYIYGDNEMPYTIADLKKILRYYWQNIINKTFFWKFYIWNHPDKAVRLWIHSRFTLQLILILLLLVS